MANAAVKEQDEASLNIKGRVERISRGPKATYLTIRVDKSPAKVTYTDVVFFRRPNDVEKGDRVHITGNIGSEKLKDYQETWKDGSKHDKWVPYLIGETVRVLGESQARIEGTGPRYANDNDRDDDIPF